MTLADLTSFVPFALFGVIAFLIFSKRGRDASIRLAFGTIIEEHGLGTTRTRSGTQTLRLLKCQRDAETFYVLEATFRRLGAMRTSCTKIDSDTLSKLTSFMR